MSKKRISIYLFRLLTSCVLVGLFISTGHYYWREYKRDQAKQQVRTLISNPPRNLNARSIGKIQETINKRTDFTFVVLGDSQRNNKVFHKVLEEASKHNPDFIIHTGDFTTAGRYDQYMEILDAIKECSVPIVFAIGNHDVNHRGIDSFSFIFGPPSFFFDIGTYRFIFLNNCESNVSPALVELSKSQHSFKFGRGIDDHELEKLESLIRDGRNNFVIMHIPPPIEPFSFYTFYKNGRNFIDLLSNYSEHISVVFSGHIHGYGETSYKGVDYIVTGGAGGELFPGKAGIIDKHNYVLVNVRGQSVTHKVFFVE